MKNMLLVSVLILLTGTLFAQTATTPAGDGSSGNPYQIATLNNLYWITQNSSSWNSHFIQTADIDATTSSTWDIGQGFSPIGDDATQFTGSYDGQEYNVTGLYIHRPSTWWIGFFGFIGNFSNSATITNVKLEGVQISGATNVGGLIGGQCNSLATNCSSTGSVNGSHQVGGLIGYQYYLSTANNCYSKGSVTGSLQDVGGLIGNQYSSSSISNCYSNCSVTGSDDCVGGLIGIQWSSSVANGCYSTGPVIGHSSNVGGLIGYQDDANVTDCYSTGSATGDLSNVGGLIGNQYAYGVVKRCYSTGFIMGGSHLGGLIGIQSSSKTDSCFWDMTSSGQTISAGGTGKDTAEMKTESTFTNAGWNFTTVWSINSSINDGYPYLASNTPTFIEGATIGTPRNFALLQNYPNPFNPSTAIQFSVQKNGNVVVKAFDVLGREVATLYDSVAQAGKSYAVTFNGSRLSSGVYFYSIKSNNHYIVKKMVMLK